MVDRLTPDRRSHLMRQVRSKDTTPELIVRRLLHAEGYRFRLYRRDLPGKPDLVFPSRRKAIFVHGCFWHGHGCKIGRLPKSRLDFWGPKIARNRERDAQNVAALRALGWQVLAVWQCETKDSRALLQQLGDFLGPPRKIRST
jgi:DNA mismatch endonuclease (patch repair protein)